MFEVRSRIHLSIILFHILVILLTLTAFFPGQMSPDSMGQLSEARTGVYDDLHPPIMAAFWGLLLHLWNNSGVLFVFHTLLYWFFFYLLTLLTFKGWEKQFAVSLIACLPPLWSQIIVLWKDTELSIALLGAYLFAILASQVSPGQLKKNKPLKLSLIGFCLVFFFYSAAVRENSFLVLIPLMIFLISSHFEKMKFFRVILLACSVSVFSLFIVHFFNYGILQTKKTFPYQISQIFDVAGVFVITRQEDLIPHYWKKLNSEVSPETLMAKYDPNSVISLVFWGDSLIRLTSEPSYLKELNEKWSEAVFHHPWAFLQHRWKAFKALMGIGMPKTYYPYHFGIERYTRGIQDQGDPFLQQVFRTYVVFFRDSFFFRGWVYLVLLFSLVLYQFLKYPTARLFHQPDFCAALSGLFYGLGYFLYTPAADFRFLYPTVLLFFLSLILAVSEATKAGEKSLQNAVREFMARKKKKVKIRS